MDCLFGIFDILGYKSFCENCDPLSAEKIIQIVDDLENEIPKAVGKMLNVNETCPQENLAMVVRRLRWLTFSDTFFVALPYDPSDHPEALKFNILFFTMVVTYMNRRMFEIGLPLRGSLHVGDAIVGKKCLGGRDVVEAHTLAENVQLAATVVSEKAMNFLMNAFPNLDAFRNLFGQIMIESEVPIKPCAISKLRTLCWFYIKIGADASPVPTDFTNFVVGAFTKHGKKISTKEVGDKVVNTVKLFESWKSANHAQYLHELKIKNEPSR